MTTKILGNQITSYTINTEQLSNTATAAFAKTLAPKILYANVTSNTYSTLDDTSVNIGGGYIVVTGAEFQPGATVLIDTVAASAVTYVDSNTLRVQVPAKAASSYNLYVVNPDGGTGIKVAGITYSTNPSWVTTSPLNNQVTQTSFNLNFQASDAITYAVANGSSIPSGTTLLANGYFYGTITVGSETTFSFDVIATDAEYQDSSKTFSVTVIASDTYYKYTTLLLQADNVSNNSVNETFVDSSNNNYTLTPSGTPIQGTVNPFGTGNWSNYFSGSGVFFENGNDNVGLRFGTEDFTIECWVCPTNLDSGDHNIIDFRAGASTASFRFGISGSNIPFVAHTSGLLNGSYSFSVGQWYHLALTRQSGTMTIWVNGASAGSATVNNNFSQGYLRVGYSQNAGYFGGYISNLRVLKGQALYTSTFTPPTTVLTAISNTQLLTCQSNSLKDVSTNALAFTTNATFPTVERFNPFGINNIGYDTSTANTTYGGSIYFNGSNDYISCQANSLDLGAGDFTFECWLYSKKQAAYNSNAYTIVEGEINGGSDNWGLGIVNYASFRGLTITQGRYAAYVVGLYSNNYLKSNVWQHIAVTRSGSTHRMFVDGVEQSLSTYNEGGTWNNSANYNSSETRYIGGAHHANPMYGYISNLRIVKGTALYTSGFTPPTTPAQPIANTSFLLSGKNSGIYDATLQNNIQTVGDVKVRTDVYKYGTGSIYFDGSGDYINTTKNINWSTSGDITVEGWIYSTSLSKSVQSILGTSYGSGDGYTFIYIYGAGSGNTGKIAVGINGVNELTSPTGTITTDTWYHIAVVRSGSTTTIYVNGTSVGSGSTAVWSNNSRPIRIGMGPSGMEFTGYMDDIRVTQGYARYTSNFTTPTRLVSL